MIREFVRPINAVAAGWSLLSGAVSGRTAKTAMPLSVSFELTNICNLHCPECASGAGLIKRTRGFMDTVLYRKVISELRPFIYYATLYFQGEPMLHPDFFTFPDNAGNIRTIVSTNGHFLTPGNSEKLALSGLSKLIVSLDGMDQATYTLYRSDGDFNKVTEGIRNVSGAIKKFNSGLKLEIQFLVNRNNEHQLPEVKMFAEEVKADLKLKSMQVINPDDVEKWMPSLQKYSRYGVKNGEAFIKSSLPNHCARVLFNPVITWDGKVIPCCFDKDAEFVMGDLNKNTFREIWNSSRYKEFRNRVFSDRKSIHICMNCSSGLKGVKV